MIDLTRLDRLQLESWTLRLETRGETSLEEENDCDATWG